jgi:hypothetical protein
MLVLKNRSSYVEVRDGSTSIFRKNKPPNHGGISGRLLASLGIVELGVYYINIENYNDVINGIKTLESYDGRIPSNAHHADEIALDLQIQQKEVTRLLK